MTSRSGERRWRPWLILGGLAAIGIVVWILVPVPFVRGIVVGGLGGPALIAGGLALLARRFRKRLRDRELEAPPLPVTTWDFDLPVTDLDGREFNLSKHRGHPMVLNHWATWCAPCMAEMPSLVRLGAALEDLSIPVVCVSKEPPETVRDFMSRKGFDLPVYTVGEPLPACFTARAIPATFVVDRSGAIVFRHLGAAAWDDPEVVRFVRNLARTPAL